LGAESARVAHSLRGAEQPTIGLGGAFFGGLSRVPIRIAFFLEIHL
jgi:hypothetical protein